MKRYTILLLVTIVFFSCEKEEEQITFNMLKSSGYEVVSRNVKIASNVLLYADSQFALYPDRIVYVYDYEIKSCEIKFDVNKKYGHILYIDELKNLINFDELDVPVLDKRKLKEGYTNTMYSEFVCGQSMFWVNNNGYLIGTCHWSDMDEIEHTRYTLVKMDSTYYCVQYIF
jgi:predicted phosphatase